MALDVEIYSKYEHDTGLILYSDFKRGQFIQGYMGDITYIIVLWDVNGIPKAHYSKEFNI